jgi:hypothetical protein
MKPILDTTKCPRCGTPHPGLTRPPLLGYVCDNCMTHRASQEASRTQQARRAHQLQRLARTAGELYPSDPKHPTFQALRDVLLLAQEGQTGVRRGWCIVGPSGLTKTRNSLNLLAEAISQKGMTADVFWGEWMADEEQRDTAKWSQADVLLMDDAFQQAGRGEQPVLFMRHLLDARRGKVTILTSQINGEEWVAHMARSNYWGPSVAANVEAVRRRISDLCTPVLWDAQAKAWTLPRAAARPLK